MLLESIIIAPQKGPVVNKLVIRTRMRLEIGTVFCLVSANLVVSVNKALTHITALFSFHTGHTIVGNNMTLILALKTC